MYIGIDLGTTGCKTGLFDSAGQLRYLAEEEYGLITGNGFTEQDAGMWKRMVLSGLAAAAAQADMPVQGISISTQGIAVVPVDSWGEPLMNAISWLDSRAVEEAAALNGTFSDLYSRTGIHMGPSYTLPKLMWLKNHRPEIFRQADKFLLPLDYLNLVLTGRALCDYTVAGGTGAFDLEAKAYSPALLDFAGVPVEKLAPLAPMGTKVGTLLPRIAAQTGLPENCPVYLGGQDQKLAALGAGIDGQTVTVSIGTATAVTRLSTHIPAQSAFCRFCLQEDAYVTEAVADTTGAALKWAKDTLFSGMDYAALDALARQAGTSGGVVFHTDMHAGGGITGLTLETTAGNVVYALYEDVSRRIASLIHRMGGASRIRLFGGGSRSSLWREILEKHTGCPVERAAAQAAAYGAACLASQMTIPR